MDQTNTFFFIFEKNYNNWIKCIFSKYRTKWCIRALFICCPDINPLLQIWPNVLLRKSRLEKRKGNPIFFGVFLSKPMKILSVNHWRYFHVYLREYLFVYDWGSPSRSVALPGTHLSTAVAWREKKFKHFGFCQNFLWY